jgi:purine-binding chemotaxis protein CheW
MGLTLTFQLNDELYGLEIDAVQEVTEDAAVQFVPRNNSILKGTINFHGRILPVIDLPVLLGFPSADRDHRLVVLTTEFEALALSVSKVSRIVDLDLSMSQASPGDDPKRAVRGVIECGDGMINLLDTERMIKQLEIAFED